MGNILNLLDRPVDTGWYRCQIRFEQEIQYHTLVNRISQMGSKFAFAPGKTAEFGVFAAPDATGKLRFLDSIDPIDSWDFPEGTKFYPGAAIAHVYQYHGAAVRIPTSDYMILYMNIKDQKAAGPRSPDGSKPAWTIIDKSKKTIIEEYSENGNKWSNPFTPQQRQLSGYAYQPASHLWLPTTPTYGAGLGAWFLPFLAKLGFFAIDALIVYLMFVSGVFAHVMEIAFRMLGDIVRITLPYILGIAAAAIAWTMIPD
jgi:hypothetical protein